MEGCTPLRYPGGKSLMTPFFIDLMKINGMKDVSYAEPFAGGAGTAINLLMQDKVNRIFINDANVCIYSFWKYVIEENKRFIDEIMKCSVDLDEWKLMHSLINDAKEPSFDRGD